MNLLHIDSSILGPHSASRALSAAATAAVVAANPGADVTYLDLAANPLPHLSGGDLAGLGEQDSNPTLDQLLAADVLVIGAALYNFTVPTQLKAWIDRICVANKTFRYTATGPQGLLGDKRVIVTLSRGGLYGEGAPSAGFEHAESYLRAVFAFLGVTNLEVIVAEGLKVSDEQRAAAMAAANDAISHLGRDQLRAAA